VDTTRRHTRKGRLSTLASSFRRHRNHHRHRRCDGEENEELITSANDNTETETTNVNAIVFEAAAQAPLPPPLNHFSVEDRTVLKSPPSTSSKSKTPPQEITTTLLDSYFQKQQQRTEKTTDHNNNNNNTTESVTTESVYTSAGDNYSLAYSTECGTIDTTCSTYSFDVYGNKRKTKKTKKTRKDRRLYAQIHFKGGEATVVYARAPKSVLKTSVADFSNTNKALQYAAELEEELNMMMPRCNLALHDVVEEEQGSDVEFAEYERDVTSPILSSSSPPPGYDDLNNKALTNSPASTIMSVSAFLHTFHNSSSSSGLR